MAEPCRHRRPGEPPVERVATARTQLRELLAGAARAAPPPDRVLSERFPDRSSATIDVVWRAADGAGSPAVRERIDGLLDSAQRLEGVGRASAPELSRDGKTAIVRLQIDAERDSEVPVETGERLIALAEQASAGGVQVAVAGWAISNAQESEVSPEVVGFAFASLILLMTFSSLLAAGLPLLMALFGLGIGTTLVGAVAALMDVPDFAPAVAGMMAIGVGIDYSLLALAAGSRPQDAAAESIATAGRSVVVAGLIVVIALLGLFAMRLPFLDGVAVSSAIAVSIRRARRGHAADRDAGLHGAPDRPAARGTGGRCPGPACAPATGRAGPATRAGCSAGRGRLRSPAPASSSRSRCRSPTSGSASRTRATIPRTR